MAIAVVAIGIMFIRLMNENAGGGLGVPMSNQRSAVLKLTIPVVATFPPMFIVKSALILWSGLTNATINVLLFCLLEVIPSLGALLFSGISWSHFLVLCGSIVVLLNYVYPITDTEHAMRERNSSKERLKLGQKHSGVGTGTTEKTASDTGSTPKMKIKANVSSGSVPSLPVKPADVASVGSTAKVGSAENLDFDLDAFVDEYVHDMENEKDH